LCHASSELRESHILPNALFRRIKQRDSGKLIAFDDSADALVDQTINTWSEPMLCHACEQRLSMLEHYALELLERSAQGGRRQEGALLRSIDYAKLKGFTTSILWRSAESSLKPFAKVSLPASYRDKLRVSLLLGQTLPPREFACRFDLLYDATPVADGGMAEDHFRTILMSPFARASGRHGSFLFLLGGYLLEIYAPSAPYREWRRPGMLKDEKNLFVPGKKIFDVPETRRLLFAGHRKSRLGLTSTALKRRDAKLGRA
jgi:hypothetical protein